MAKAPWEDINEEFGAYLSVANLEVYPEKFIKETTNRGTIAGLGVLFPPRIYNIP